MTETIYAEKITDHIYRCLESSIFGSLSYGDEIEVENKNEELEFLRIYKESTFKTYRHLWSKEIIESEKFKRMKDEIMALGGQWEQAMGGIFIFHLPKEKVNEVERLYKIFAEEA